MLIQKRSLLIILPCLLKSSLSGKEKEKFQNVLACFETNTLSD